MRFMMLVKADERSEAGLMPENAKEVFEQMGRYNDELVKAGVLLAGDGLQPSSKGFRVDFDGETPVVVDGPFAETKELIAGFWILQVSSREEAVEWARRVPFSDGVLEVRQVFETADFPADVLSPELAAHEEELRARLAAQS